MTRVQTPTLTESLFDPILNRDPAGPRITYYDDRGGPNRVRVELSGETLANWAAKTANMIRDEFGLSAGSRVAVLLGAHWQTAAALFGIWWAGAEVVLAPDPDADLTLTTVERLDETPTGGDVAVLSLDAFGSPVPDLPAGVTDFATSVRVHGDQFVPRGAGAALDGASVDDVLVRARQSATGCGIATDDRVLSERSWNNVAGLIDGLIAVFAAGAALVQVTHPDPTVRQSRIESEHVTVTL